MAFYIRPIILWISMLVICHGLDPIILKSSASHAIKERFLNFVRSLSTVLTFAFCTASLTQQIQKFVERSTSPEATRNLGVQFVGNTVYTLVWIAAVILFMELLGFSTQKWITAGGFGTVLITLAGRELVTNFLSSIMIHATRPFMVNEWIQTKIDGYEVSGTVEHVGWWEPSIIRGDDREAIYIPNHKFTVTVLRNLSQKTHWRIKTYFAISHLDVNKIGDIISTMRKVVAKHPQIEQRHLHRRIFLEEIKQDSNALMIMVSIFVKTSHFEEYLRVREMVILDLLKVISHYGARLATPLRSVQRVYDESEARGSGFREYGVSKSANSRPFLLLSQLEAEVQEMADLSPATVLEVSPSTQSSPTPSRAAPLKEMSIESSPTPKTKTEVEENLIEEKKSRAPISTSTPSNASPSSKPVKGMKEKNYESDDDLSSLDSNYTSDDELRVSDVPQKSSPTSESRSKPGVSSPSTNNAKSPSSSPPLSPSVASSSSPNPSAVPSASSLSSPSEVRSALEGLDSMGLNDRDITLLGAAFEKSHANNHQSTLDSSSTFSKSTDLGVVSVELEEVISSRSPASLKNVVKESEKEEKKSEPAFKVVNASVNSTSTVSPPLNPPTPASPSFTEANSPKISGTNNESSEQDFWHAPLPSSSSPPSPTSLESPTVENEFASLQNSLTEKESNLKKTVDAGKMADDTQNEEFDSSNSDTTLVTSSPPISTNSASVSPIIQSVEENIVLDVAINGLKKTLPLDDDLSAIGNGASFPQDASSSREIDGKEKELKMSVATPSKVPTTTSPQESNKGEGQLKEMDR